MLFPKTIQVMGLTYTITECNDPIKTNHARGTITTGEIDHGLLDIKYYSQLATPVKDKVIWHELVHSFEDIIGLRLNEKEVDLFAGLLQQVTDQIVQYNLDNVKVK